MLSRSKSGRTRCSKCNQSFIFDRELHCEYNRIKTPRKVVACQKCGRPAKTKGKTGRLHCSGCGKSFIYDKEAFKKYHRAHVSKPEVRQRIKDWTKTHQTHLSDLAKKRYWAKHDHIRRLNNLASARKRGVSAIPLEGICELCGMEKKHMHRHHILPQAAGGENSETNLLRVCNRCHKILEAIIVNELARKYPQVFLEIANSVILEVKEKNGINRKQDHRFVQEH